MIPKEAARKAAEEIAKLRYSISGDEYEPILTRVISTAIASATAAAEAKYAALAASALRDLTELQQRADRAEAALKILAHDYPVDVAAAMCEGEAPCVR